MVHVEEWMDVQAMHRRGMSISEIARRTGRCRKTIRRYLKNPHRLPEYTRKKVRESILDPYKDYLLLRMREEVFNCEKLLGEIQKRGYPGKLTILRCWVRSFRDEARRVAEVRFETEPGHQAQADLSLLWSDLP